MDIQQVARKARVSTATVWRVINDYPNVREQTVARVRKVIADLNYVPINHARNLRVGSARMFGLAVSDINNPFFPELIDAFEALATAHGIDVIFNTNYDPQRLQNSIRRTVERNVDAIAVMTSEMDIKIESFRFCVRRVYRARPLLRVCSLTRAAPVTEADTPFGASLQPGLNLEQ